MKFNELAEGYFNSSTTLKAIKKAKYIYFIDEDEVHLVTPYYKVISRIKGLSDQEVVKWVPCDLVIGEDVMDLMPEMPNIDSSTWYVANDSIPGDHTFKTLVGYCA